MKRPTTTDIDDDDVDDDVNDDDDNENDDHEGDSDGGGEASNEMDEVVLAVVARTQNTN